jgi:hypothetical protein
MAGGLFDSGGGGSSYSYTNFGGGSGNSSPQQTLITVAIFLVILGGVALYQHCELEHEQELDRGIYIETATANYITWLGAQKYKPLKGTFWLEDGSSHREVSERDYHCKGGQFRLPNRTVTFCCSVKVGEQPPCMEIVP